jgi:peptidoglycan hydrolase-like protein with peptidoglycan-binding domain
VDTVEQTQAAQQTPRQAYADWPQKGDQRPQPWDLDAIGISLEARQLEKGAPDTVSPIVIRHSFPVLTSGSASPAVGELAQRLQVLGYSTDLSRGENPFGHVTQDIMAAVSQFREDFGVKEDPTPYGGNTEQSRQKAANTIGPFTWEGLLRASDRLLQAA